MMHLCKALFVLFAVIIFQIDATSHHHHRATRGFTISPSHFTSGITNDMTIRCDLGHYVYAVSKALVLQLSKVDSHTVATLVTEQQSGNGPVLVATSLKNRSSTEGKIDPSDVDGTYIQLTLTNLTSADSGQYMCTLTVMDNTGYVQTMTVNSTVTHDNITVDSLLTHVNHLHNKIDQMNGHAVNTKNHTAMLEDRLSALEREYRNGTQKSVALEAQVEHLTEELRQVRSELNTLSNNRACPASCVTEMDNLETRVNDSTALIKTQIIDMLQETKFHVSFFAHHTSVPGGLVALHHADIVEFREVVLNAGGGYDNQRGTFVAPVNGTYVFMLNIPIIDTDTLGQFNIALTVNFDQTIAQIEKAVDKAPNSLTVMRHLSVGDQVNVYSFKVAGSQSNSAPMFSKYASYFGGFLLSKD